MYMINKTFEDIEIFFVQTNGNNLLVFGFLLLEVLSLTTSVMVIIYQNKTKKNEILKKVFKHLQIMIIIIFGRTIDKFIIQQGNNTSNILLLYYVGHLSVRILDKSSILGVPVPAKVYSLISRFSSKSVK
jgi:phage-related holin